MTDLNFELPYKQIHLDFHTSEKIQGIGMHFNGEEFAKTLRDASVTSIHVLHEGIMVCYIIIQKNSLSVFLRD